MAAELPIGAPASAVSGLIGAETPILRWLGRRGFSDIPDPGFPANACGANRSQSGGVAQQRNQGYLESAFETAHGDHTRRSVFMQRYPATVPPPSGDRRWKLVEGALRRHGSQSSALLEVLHAVQEAFGYIDGPALRYVAHALNLPASKVYGVVTFYRFFNLKPQGEHACVICTGTACYIKGAARLLNKVQEMAGLRPGETSKDNRLSR
jgi:bidirectional [NiFe] hydrogenase diaphorase subunit